MSISVEKERETEGFIRVLNGYIGPSVCVRSTFHCPRTIVEDRLTAGDSPGRPVPVPAVTRGLGYYPSGIIGRFVDVVSVFSCPVLGCQDSLDKVPFRTFDKTNPCEKR